MRHHAQYIAASVTNPGNVVERTIGIGFRINVPVRSAIAKHNAIVPTQIAQGLLIAEIVSRHVSDGNREDLSFMATVGECSVADFDAAVNWLANVLQTHVANERSRQHSRFAKNLEAIADA